ncbi:MAG TPA: Sec-independent protein translocase protein TatB [Gammaproteobacteria bacterium]|nr:Sec-independent protein translocase protein TatB [Gammaproteobacteria bacterium]
MSGIGPSELIVLVVIGLLILGPERLPRVASQIGRWVGKARRTANQLRYQLEREVALADIEKDSKKKDSNTKDSKSRPDDSIAGSRDSPNAERAGAAEHSAAKAPDAARQPDSPAEAAAATEAGADGAAKESARPAPEDDKKPG